MNKLIKILGGAVVAMMLLALFAGAALAAGPHNSDRDGDGVRDLVSTGESLGQEMAHGFVDADGDGVNDRYVADHEFVDEDGDGVCDLCDGTPSADGSYSFAYSENYSSAGAQSGRYSHNYAAAMNGTQAGTCIAE